MDLVDVSILHQGSVYRHTVALPDDVDFWALKARYFGEVAPTLSHFMAFGAELERVGGVLIEDTHTVSLGQTADDPL